MVLGVFSKLRFYNPRLKFVLMVKKLSNKTDFWDECTDFYLVCPIKAFYECMQMPQTYQAKLRTPHTHA
jgi:hypothetical protein